MSPPPLKYYDRGLEDEFNGILDGSYAIAELPCAPRVVLDIGANVGAFARWARGCWPDAEIHCYEPATALFALLEENLAGDAKATAEKVAISEKAGSAWLYYGKCNSGCNSLYQLGEQTALAGEKVLTLAPDLLPPADFIKIDTEGAEVEILNGYAHLGAATAVAVECHRFEDMAPIRGRCEGAGLMFTEVVGVHSGERPPWVMKFLRLPR
jgi:FkbM family methyltransferase